MLHPQSSRTISQVMLDQFWVKHLSGRSMAWQNKNSNIGGWYGSRLYARDDERGYDGFLLWINGQTYCVSAACFSERLIRGV